LKYSGTSGAAGGGGAAEVVEVEEDVDEDDADAVVVVVVSVTDSELDTLWATVSGGVDVVVASLMATLSAVDIGAGMAVPCSPSSSVAWGC